MSDDIFNQIGRIIAKKSHSGVSKDAAEWISFLENTPNKAAEPAAEPAAKVQNAPAADRNFKPVPRPVQQPFVQRAPEPAVPAQQPLAERAAEPQEFHVNSLEELHRMVSGCRRCPLANSRNNLVFGEGNPHAELMFIGEAPGADEDATGRPFVGKAGQLLDKMITAMQFSRQEIYIANILKCRPPYNRNPEPGEAACCIAYLEEQIRLVNPKYIVLLGAVATRFLLKYDGPVGRIRGTWQNYKNIPVMVTYHPSFLLRTADAKKEAWSDLQQVMAKFGKFHKKG